VTKKEIKAHIESDLEYAERVSQELFTTDFLLVRDLTRLLVNLLDNNPNIKLDEKQLEILAYGKDYIAKILNT
jgi:hypothetical protein|tara:strand:- start:249 stop:467 length:219 start_codon:yes stop_codon:yes gene_type:complete